MAKASNIAIADALLRQFRSGLEPDKIAEGLAAFLIEERRIGDKNAILRDVERQLFNLESTLYVRTTSASELTAELNQQISEIFSRSTEAKKVIISSEINQDVIGGVRCQTTDLVLDLTIRRQLQQLKGAITVN
ncbi:F0F1 ATP synthase subunit delta [Candidatus Saccharibacteria bacterium]|nr:F0F1 ATP synthase subunit delta [Candidatus Saccharibacteria bacterium]